MPQCPHISLCIPVYNNADFLAEAIASIQAQTLQNWELRIVDDGSRDASQEILTEAARQDPRIHLTCHRNQGIGGTRNRALDAIQGETFLHMDADDRLLPHALERLWDARQRSGATLIIGKMTPFTGTPPTEAPDSTGECLTGDIWYREIYAAIDNCLGSRIPFPTWNKLYDTATFGHFRYLPLVYGDDTWYTPLTHFSTASAYLLDTVTYAWRVAHTSASSGTCNVRWMSDYATVLNQVSTLPNLPPAHQKAFRQALLRPAKWIARTLLRDLRKNPRKYPSRALRQFVRTMRSATIPWPFSWKLRFFLLTLRAAFTK